MCCVFILVFVIIFVPPSLIEFHQLEKGYTCSGPSGSMVWCIELPSEFETDVLAAKSSTHACLSFISLHFHTSRRWCFASEVLGNRGTITWASQSLFQRMFHVTTPHEFTGEVQQWLTQVCMEKKATTRLSELLLPDCASHGSNWLTSLW